MEKNQIVRLEIDSYSHDGSGVGRVDGFAVFVPFSAAGDVLDVRIVKVAKTYAFGKTVEIITPSPARQEPPCKVFGRCGGCQLMHVRYEEQLKLKHRAVADALQRIGGFSDIKVLQPLGMAQPMQYRNKAQYPVGMGNGGDIITGFYSPRSHQIIPNLECAILHPASDEVAACVRRWVKEFGIAPYNEETGRGILRHVYTRVGFESGEIMAVLVVTTQKIPYLSELITRMKRLKINITSFQLNVNAKDTNIVLGKENVVLFGSDKITDSLGGIAFEISPQSFYQVNPVQTKVLYTSAMEMANIKKEDIVFDLYCGIGTISLFVAGSCKEIHGIEIVPEAVEDAKSNAQIGGIVNAFFHCGDAAQKTAELIESGIKPDVVIIDPPRKGCESEMIDLLKKLSPPRILYISCNPATLARDLRLLADDGYQISEVQPVDLFPHTGHVECVVEIRRVDCL